MKVTLRDIALILTTLVAIGSLAVMAVKGRFDARRDARAAKVTERTAAIAEAETVVAMLKEQIEEYRTERTDVAAEHKAEKDEWRVERKRLEDRIGALEAQYSALVLTVTTMGFCAKAARCPDYDPGDRREKRVATTTYTTEG